MTEMIRNEALAMTDAINPISYLQLRLLWTKAIAAYSSVCWDNYDYNPYYGLVHFTDPAHAELFAKQFSLVVKHCGDDDVYSVRYPTTIE